MLSPVALLTQTNPTGAIHLLKFKLKPCESHAERGIG